MNERADILIEKCRHCGGTIQGVSIHTSQWKIALHGWIEGNPNSITTQLLQNTYNRASNFGDKSSSASEYISNTLKEGALHIRLASR